MNVLRFNSEVEMRAYLIQAQADANKNLHLLQSSITYGSHWVRFVDIASGIVEFGRVAEKHEVVDLEISAGATAREAARVALQTLNQMEQGYLYGIAYSKLDRDGEWGYTHKAHVWPVEETLFNAAAECNYQMELLPLSQRINLQAAFTAYRTRGAR